MTREEFSKKLTELLRHKATITRMNKGDHIEGDWHEYNDALEEYTILFREITDAFDALTKQRDGLLAALGRIDAIIGKALGHEDFDLADLLGDMLTIQNIAQEATAKAKE